MFWEVFPERNMFLVFISKSIFINIFNPRILEKTSIKTQWYKEYITCYDVQIKTPLIETEGEILIVIFHEATALFPVSFNTSCAVAEVRRDRSVPHPVRGHGVMSCHVMSCHHVNTRPGHLSSSRKLEITIHSTYSTNIS